MSIPDSGHETMSKTIAAVVLVFGSLQSCVVEQVMVSDHGCATVQQPADDRLASWRMRMMEIANELDHRRQKE